MKCIHFGSYWMGKNDIVYAMFSDLKRICTTVEADVGIYSSSKKKMYVEDFSKSKTYPIRIIDHDYVVALIRKHHPNFVVCNAGGLSFSAQTRLFLKKNKVITVGISLSDPDVFEDQGKQYYKQFDLFFTNSIYSLDNQYTRDSHVYLLPFAASKHIHKPIKLRKKHDIVVVGHAREDRIELISKLSKKFSIKTYGSGWGGTAKVVQGNKQVKAINEGKVYLSFPKTLAGFTNVKVGLFEAAACKSCIIVPYFRELEKYFTCGLDVLSPTNEDEMIECIETYIHNDRLRNWIASNAYSRFLTDHTWEKRWEFVIERIKKIYEHAY